jgi:NADH-quinone oxidoreductase subunit L
MTRLFVLTFHGPKRWTEDQSTRTSPRRDDDPADPARDRLVFAGWLMSTSVVDWLTPVFEGSPGAEPAAV